MSELLPLLGAALSEKRWDDYDEIWLDYIEEEKGTFEDFLGAAEEALVHGEGERAGLPLSLLAPQANTLETPRRRRFYELLVSCAHRRYALSFPTRQKQ